MPAILLLAVWKNFGFNMVVFLAGLQSIPARLYEAAHLDRAGPWQGVPAVTPPPVLPRRPAAAAPPDPRLRHGDHEHRLLPALRGAVRDDAGRAGGCDAQRGAAH